MPPSSTSTPPTPEAILKALIAKFPADDQKLIRSVRSAVRKLLPALNELVYDYRTHMVLSYTPTQHGKDGVIAISARKTGVELYFNHGKQLPDPTKLLQSKGGEARFMAVESARQLKDPDVSALIRAAIGKASVPLPTKGRGQLMDRSVAQQKRRTAKS